MRSLVAVLVLVASQARATDYYVAPLGSDGDPGTIDRPMKTLGAAAAVAIAGDTVRVRAGSYTGGFFTRSGSAAEPIRFLSHDGPRLAVLENANEPLRIGGGAAYLEFVGFEVRNSVGSAIRIAENAHHIVLSTIYAHDAGLDGDVLRVNQAHNIVIDASDLSAPGASATNPNMFQEVVDFEDVADSVVRRSFIHDGSGVLIQARGSSQGIIFEQNVIGRQSAIADAGPAVGLGGVTETIRLKNPYEVTNIVMRNSIIFAAGRGAVGIYDAKGAYLANNLFLNNDVAVIRMLAGGGSATGSDDVRVANNLFVDTRGALPAPYARVTDLLTNFSASFNAYWNNRMAILPATGGVPADTSEMGRLTDDPRVSGATSFASWADAVAAARPGDGSSALMPGLDTSLGPFAVSDDIRGFQRSGRRDRGPYNLGVAADGDGGVLADGGMFGSIGGGTGGVLPARGCGCTVGGARSPERGGLALALAWAAALAIAWRFRRRA